MSSSRPKNDGLCHAPSITMPARHLLSTFCVLGGAKCPLISKPRAQRILDKAKRDPTVSIRLTSTADELPHYTALGPDGCSEAQKQDAFNRKRDLDVLQRLGLVPGDTRRSRFLYETLFQRIETHNGL